MPLKILHANRVETLFDDLAGRIVAAPAGAGVLEPETILLENPAMGSWINLQLARRHGVAANIRYLRLSGFFWALARAVVSADIPDDTPMNKAEMSWRLFGILQDPAVTARAELAPVIRYLAPGGRPDEWADLKRYQLAARVADLFDQYQMYRPQWVEDGWDRGREAGAPRDCSDDWRAAETWQRVLWQTLRDRAGGAALPHRAAIHRRLCERLGSDAVPASLPFRRLFVFGVTALPASDLDVLLGLARHLEVCLYLFNPCAQHWCDIPGLRQAVREDRARYADGRADPALPPPEIGNPLLAAQAQQVRDFLVLTYAKAEEYLLAAEVEDDAVFTEPAPARDTTLLAAVQQDILELSFRGEIATLERESGEPWPLPGGECDGAPGIHIHSCHGPLREVEVLHDQLLDLFDRDPDLSPRDVVVMMPRVAPYVPYIRAVFEGTRRPDGRRLIDYHITDRTLVEESPILNSFQTLLRLPESRLPLSEVLGLLELPAVQRRFGLERGDYETLRQWLIDAGVRWGLDARHREAETGAAYREFSWDFGLDRMLAGYAMAAGAGREVLGVQPLDDIEGGNAAAFDGLLRFWRQLRRYRDGMARDHDPAVWARLLNGLLDDFYLPGEDDRRAFLELRRGLENLATAGEAGWHEDPIALSVVRAAVQPVLQQTAGRRHPWSEGVKFCSLLPMRGVPFEVVYLMGMNMEDYPRRIDRPGFDLMRDDYRPGDRSARVDDRWLFLEALLSARRAFHVSYAGQDMHRNESREPSVVVSELIDYLRDGYQTGAFDDEGQLQPGRLFTRHPLQPFHPAYFKADPDGDDRCFSFDRVAFDIAHAQAVSRNGQVGADADERWRAPAVIATGPQADGDDTPVEVDVDDFARFFAQPAQWFFRHRGISLSRYEDMVSDEEIWADGDGLQTWQRVNGLLERIERGGRAPGADLAAEKSRVIAAYIDEQRAAGSWPLGTGGDRAASSLDNEIAKYWFFLVAAGPGEPRRIDHPVAGASPERAGLHVTGALACRGGRYLLQSASKQSRKGILDFYIRTALVAASHPDISEAWAVFRTGRKTLYKKETLDDVTYPTRFSDDFLADRPRHETFLGRLAGLYLAYRERGLPFHPDLGLVLPGAPSGEREVLAQEAWCENRVAMRHSLRDRAYYVAPETLLSESFLAVSDALTVAVKEWAGIGDHGAGGQDAD